MGEYNYRNTYLFGIQDPWMELYPRALKYIALVVAVGMTPLMFKMAWRTFCSARVTITSPYTETANGTITKLNLKRIPQKFGATPELCVELEYVYKVKGQEFTAMRHRPTDSAPISSLDVPELLENYRLGDSVIVSYNPVNISDAVLETQCLKKDSITHLLIVVIITLVMWIIVKVTP